jgi:hypothetical protein
MVFSGFSPDRKLAEIAEVADHPWMVGTQFHPEFKSRPNRPHPLFVGFVKAAKARRDKSKRGRTSYEVGKEVIPKDEVVVESLSEEA